MVFWSVLAVVAALVVGIFVFVIGIYNRLVQLNNLCKNGFAQIEVQLKRRYDLIPNLVEATRAYMKHESETLEAVINARNQASSGLAAAGGNVANTEAIKAWMGAESQLAGAMGRLSFVMEDYPELKANETIAQLTEELTSTENRVAFSRQAFNDWVTSFNTYRQGFPTIVLAGLFGYGQDLELLQIEQRDAIQEAPKVSLT